MIRRPTTRECVRYGQPDLERAFARRHTGGRMGRREVSSGARASAGNLEIEQEFPVSMVARNVPGLVISQQFSPSIVARTSGGSGVVPDDFEQAAIDAGLTTLTFAHADQDVTQSGGFVSAWGSSGTQYVQAGADALKPNYSATGGPNGLASVSGDGSAKYMTLAVDAPLPGTTPITAFGVCRINAWASATRIHAGGAGAQLLFRMATTAEPEVDITNGSASGRLNMTTGTWFFWYIHFNNSTSADRFRVGATDSGTGTSFGNNNSASMACFAGTGGANPGNVSAAMFYWGTGAISQANLAALVTELVTLTDDYWSNQVET